MMLILTQKQDDLYAIVFLNAKKNFEVKGSDPHDFDGEGDGVGCES